VVASRDHLVVVGGSKVKQREWLTGSNTMALSDTDKQPAKERGIRKTTCDRDMLRANWTAAS